MSRPYPIDIRVHHGRRALCIEALGSVLLPPVIFSGLLASLWFYKCCMMVVFQNKIIYMPGVPPFARQEKIANYARACHPVVWKEERIMTEDGKDLALCVGEIRCGSRVPLKPSVHVVVLYFQGYEFSFAISRPDIDLIYVSQ